MLKTIKMGFENTEVFELPAEIIDLRLTHITESIYTSHFSGAPNYESFAKEIGEGYVGYPQRLVSDDCTPSNSSRTDKD
ncbi:hypothetical protein [Agrilactobacillus composti]|uniref:hypothetical protein n=1 Tax=Agrilactobacillus composti TaxID=398555 RepID=UPI000557C451|nr:hypothetical protein [Agrilactobacillus composti]